MLSKSSLFEAGLFALLITLIGSGSAKAETDLKFSSFVKEVSVGGDYRLRYDNEHFKKAATADRGRFRMRLRIGTDFALPNNVKAKFRLATGTGEQVSTNQTFGTLETGKGIFVDRAYLEWTPIETIKLQGGKMANPLWTPYSTDVVFDGDLNPEGASESISYLAGGAVNFFATAMQMVADENRTDYHDQQLFTEQVGAEVRLPMESRFKVGLAYHDWRHMKNDSPFTLGPSTGAVQEGNRRLANGGLASDFGVAELTAEFSSWISRLPVSVQGTFVKNNRVNDAFAERKDTGYQVGTILGKAKEAHSWEAAYFYKYVETDATVADVADSDFGDGGTNRFGHIMWFAYNPTDWLTCQTKYFITKNIDPTLTGFKGDINRLQVDAVVKF